MDNLFVGNVGFLHFPVEPYCPRCYPASCALWKSLRNDPGQGSDREPEVTGLKSESVTGFIPESLPASFRNAARHDFVIVTALPWNPHSPPCRSNRFPRSPS